MGIAKRTGKIGSSFASTLMVGALVLVLAFLMVANAYSHLNFSSRAENSQRAANLAESALSLALERLLDDPAYGTGEEATLEIRHPSAPEDSSAVITFDQAAAARRQLPFSTNNLQGDNSVPAWGDLVLPKESAHLIATADCGGVKRSAEAVVTFPRYPYVVATSGRFVSDGGLLVARVAEDGTLLDSELLPGDLLSNSVDIEAVFLGPDSRITGDVKTAGEVVLDRTSSVEGEVLERSDPGAIPFISVDSYDPKRQGKEYQVLPNELMTAPTCSGYLRRGGNLQVTDGLYLDGAVLYVDGSLSVEGGVHGRGALFVKGPVQLAGGSSFSSDNQAALVADGDIAIDGDGDETSFFQGMIYSEGNLRASQITLMGSFIANSSEGCGGEASVSNSRLVMAPEVADIEFSVGAASDTFYFQRNNATYLGNRDAGYTQNGVALPVRVEFLQGNYSLWDPATGEKLDGLTQDELVGKLNQILASVLGDPDADISNDPSLQAHLDQLATAGHGDDRGNRPTAPDEFEINPNQFLSPGEKMRILVWRVR
ncbi:MAG: hypothetical protein HY319_27050 [Armatimonadetes bacterium]|nr:hypothetical protein [Armatimonadota bacterium]